jgi:TRAP-type C4-dicarboxylate transport system substrate-binding protein
MVGAVETLNAIRDGVVDSGFVYEAYQPTVLAYSSLFADMVAFNRDSAATIAAVMETYFFSCPQCLEEFKANNAIPIVGHATAPGYLLCNREISSVDDLVGLRIRATQRFQVDAVKAFGGVPVNIAFSDVVPALEQGNIDCVPNGPYILEAYGLAGIVKTVITTEHLGAYVSGSTFTMRRDLWDSLSDKVKTSIVRAAPDWAAKATMAQVEQGDRALADAVASGKVKAVDLGEPFLAKWRAFIAGERVNVVKFAKERGIADPEPLIEAYLKNFDKWAAISKSVNGDSEAFSQKMWDEIYSKVKF